MKTSRWLMVVTWALAAGTPLAAESQTFVTVQLDTSSLVGHPAAPFALDFQLNGGSAGSAGNNTVTLAGFRFGGGNLLDGPVRVGGATGDLASALTLTDTAFHNAATQHFVPGSELTFIVRHTTNVDSGDTPDQFSVAILDRTGAEVPTRSPSTAFLVVDLNSTTATVQSFASDGSQAPRGGGPPVTVSAAAVEVALAIEIDINPGEQPNSINAVSAGTIPVAIVSSADFDAPSAIDPTSPTFGQTGDEPSLRRPPVKEDVNGDGRPDLICHFDTTIAGFASGRTIGVLKARTADGARLQGWDSIRLVRTRR